MTDVLSELSCSDSDLSLSSIASKCCYVGLQSVTVQTGSKGTRPGGQWSSLTRSAITLVAKKATRVFPCSFFYDGEWMRDWETLEWVKIVMFLYFRTTEINL